MVGKYFDFFSKRKLIIILIGLCLLQAGFSGYLEKFSQGNPNQAYYLPQINRLSGVSPNLKVLWADFFYIKGVMGLTDIFPDKLGRFDYIQDNMAVALGFDHGLINAYFFAACIAPYDKQSLAKGIGFLLKYRYFDPDDWRIPYWTGFNYYQMGDYLKAAFYYRNASEFSGAPNFLKSNLAMLYYRGGNAQAGLAYLEGLAASVKESKNFPGLNSKIAWLKNIILLEQKAEQFREKFGCKIKSLDELKSAGLLKNIPEDSFGREFYWDLAASRVKSRFFAD
jgi:tetratricopeptide (TPR) repeat protein